MDNTTKKNSVLKIEQIDFLDIYKKIWGNKALYIKVCSICLLIGILYAIDTPKTYTTYVKLAPENSDNSLSGSISNVTSMLGIGSLGNLGSGAINPQIYPDIINSNDFVLHFYDMKIKQENIIEEKKYWLHIVSDNIPYRSYPKKWIKSMFKKKSGAVTTQHNPFWLSKDEQDICGLIKENISCTIDKKNDVITIAVKDKDRLVSATIADSVVYYLQDFITNYRTQKTRNDLSFVEKTYAQCQEEYQEAQKKYIALIQKNQNLSQTTTAKFMVEDARNEMDIKQSLLLEVTKQMQFTRQQLQEKTPAFTIIQQASVPYKASSLPRFVIVLLFGILGFLGTSFWIFVLRKRNIAK